MSPAGRHTVKLHGIVVGYSDLEHVDPVLGVARGRFRPGVGYDLVQPIFRLFTEAVPDAVSDALHGGQLGTAVQPVEQVRGRDAACHTYVCVL